MVTGLQSAIYRTTLTFGLGAAFGAPGYIIGGVLGTVLFPPDAPEAPDPYTDLFLNTSNEFIPIPLLYGVNKTPGNFIYKGALRSRKVTSGGKGGQKTVTGYEYWGNWAIGVGRGPLDTTRMYKGNDLIIHEGDASITLHRGEPDQTVDTDWDGFVDQAVPLKNFAYEMYVDHYLGEDNKTPPPLYRETHRFPFSDSVDANPYVFNKVRESLTDGGVALKDKWDNTYIINCEGAAGADYIKVYDPDWTLNRTIDISSLAITDEWDATITYYNGNGWMNLYYVKTGSVQKQRIIVTKFPLFKSTITAGNTANVKTYTIVDNEWHSYLEVTSNEDYCFIASEWAGVASVFITSAAAPGTLLDTIDVSGDLATPDDITCNSEYFFVLDGTDVFMYDVAGVAKDDYTIPNFTGSAICILALYGGPHLIAYEFGEQLDVAEWEDTLAFITYDRSTELFVSHAVPDIDADVFWASGATPFRDAAIRKASMYEGPDGVVLISAEQNGVLSTMQLLVDANPAQIIYDLVVNVRDTAETRLALTALTEFGSRCVTNRIGLSFPLAAKKSVGAVLKDILAHTGGQVYRDNSGAFSFYMPLSTDASEGAIAAADVLASRAGGPANYELINTTLKDIEICPNRLNIRYNNRLNGYKRDATVQLDDMLSIAEDGEIVDEDVHFNMFSNEYIIRRAGWRAWKNGRLNNKMHQLDLNGKWLWVQPGMVFTLNMADQGFNGDRVRVFSVDDPPLDSDAFISISVQMDDDYLTSLEDVDYDASLSGSTSLAPPTPVIPIVWEEDALQTDGSISLAISVIRETEDTTAVDIFTSKATDDNFGLFDRVESFGDIADVAGAVAVGDTEITINTDAYPDSTFAAFDVTDQRNNFSRCIMGTQVAEQGSLDEFEIVSYRDVRASGANYVLEDCARGKDYTLPQAHGTDEIIVLVGRGYARKTISLSNAGVTWYIKCIPRNAAGTVVDDLTTVTTYAYTVKGYAAKATHAAGLELYQDGAGLGALRTVDANTFTIQWVPCYRLGGWARAASEDYRYGTFNEGDVLGYDVMIYTSGGVLQATHLDVTTAEVAGHMQYEYTSAQNAIDFGVLTKSLMIGVRPFAYRGAVGEDAEYIVNIPVTINTV